MLFNDACTFHAAQASLAFTCHLKDAVFSFIVVQFGVVRYENALCLYKKKKGKEINYSLALIDFIGCGWSKEWLVCFGGAMAVFTLCTDVVLKEAQEAKLVYVADCCQTKAAISNLNLYRTTPFNVLRSFCMIFYFFIFITSLKAGGSLGVLVSSKKTSSINLPRDSTLLQTWLNFSFDFCLYGTILLCV